jgi:purine-binding chemotaxis protein CheW
MRSGTRRLVTFGVGSACYAADIAAVERVLRVEGVQPVPGMPAWMEGVIDYAGRVVPVVDLRRRLAGAGVPDEEAGAPGRLLVLARGGELLAARVDRVLDVRAVATDDVAPAPAMVQEVAGDFVLGVTRRDGAMVFVIDVPRLFSLEEHDRLQSVGADRDAMRRHDPASA